MIYLLEDDASIRKLVTYTLRTAGLSAMDFAVPSHFWQAVEEETPSLVLLDLMLPEEDGLSILSKLKARHDTARVPVMILTAKNSEFDKVVGLDSGADDYMTKPFGMMEMLSRVKALLRRFDAGASLAREGFVRGSLYLSPERHVVEVAGERITLSLKEFKLLCYLAEKDGRVADRDELLNAVWGYSFDGESRTVDVHIRTLRQKLGEAGVLIETVKGIGYKIADEA